MAAAAAAAQLRAASAPPAAHDEFLTLAEALALWGSFWRPREFGHAKIEVCAVCGLRAHQDIVGVSGITLCVTHMLTFAQNCAQLTIAQLHRGPRRAPELAAFALGGPQAPGTHHGSYGTFAVGVHEMPTISQRIEHAEVLERLGEWQAARAAFVTARDLQARAFGVDNPTALQATAGIVRVGFAQHRTQGPALDAVRALHATAVAQFTRVFGAWHSRTRDLINAWR